ncbi:hypothetical protein ScPMuIL_005818 [Solemya velum]
MMSKRGLRVVLLVFTAIVLLMVGYNKQTQSAQLLHNDVKDIPSTFEVEPLTDTKSKEFQEKQEERFKAIRERISLRLESDLTVAEKASINACIPLIEQTTFNMEGFGLEVRRFQLDYLTDYSNVIEIGGNIGRDSSLILQSHNPMKYILLEPIEHLYKKLVEQFRNRREVSVYNFGLAATDGVFYIALSGDHEEGTSIFTDKGGQHAIRLMNTTNFFAKLGLGTFECDLLLINCEGCKQQPSGGHMIRVKEIIMSQSRTTIASAKVMSVPSRDIQ